MTLWNMVIMRMKCDYIQLQHGEKKNIVVQRYPLKEG